jgi:hypothetical protein
MPNLYYATTVEIWRDSYEKLEKTIEVAIDFGCILAHTGELKNDHGYYAQTMAIRLLQNRTFDDFVQQAPQLITSDDWYEISETDFYLMMPYKTRIYDEIMLSNWFISYSPPAYLLNESIKEEVGNPPTPIDMLRLPPNLQDQLARVGITTVEDVDDILERGKPTMMYILNDEGLYQELVRKFNGYRGKG